jgi:FolB domain-containing protein
VRMLHACRSSEAAIRCYYHTSLARITWPKLAQARAISTTNTPSRSRDQITVSELSLQPRLAGWAWAPDTPRILPVKLTLAYMTDVSRAGASDDLTNSISYSEVSDKIVQLAGSKTWRDLWELAQKVADLTLEFEGTTGDEEVTVRLEHPSALLGAESAGLEITRAKARRTDRDDDIFIRGFKVDTVIGVNPAERTRKQPVILNLEGRLPPGTERGPWVEDAHSMVHAVIQVRRTTHRDGVCSLG